MKLHPCGNITTTASAAYTYLYFFKFYSETYHFMADTDSKFIGWFSTSQASNKHFIPYIIVAACQVQHAVPYEGCQ